MGDLTGGAATPTSAGSEPAPPARPTGLRMASVHLRMGSLALARAELESFAGRGLLDEDALLDLAEVRWRTGDLAGGGEAANTLLGLGREDALALVIAAESVAAIGRPGEARRLAARAVAAAGEDAPALDELFAGMPRSLIWPESAPASTDPSPATATAAPRPTASHGSASPARGAASVTAGSADAPASPAAAEAFAGGLAALGGGDPAQAALHLGVALRLEPAFADAVLDAIGDRAAERHLALVAGDAYRLLGRESEALAAFDRARGGPPGNRTTHEDELEPGSEG